MPRSRRRRQHFSLFDVAWVAAQQVYDHEAVTDASVVAHVARVIGGMVATNIDSGEWKNTCAVRMSYILGRSGVQIPHVAGKTVSGADKRWYFFRVKHLIEFLSLQWGKPDLAAPYPPAGGGALAGKRGIVLFEVSGWRDATVHATLWNGRICYDHCYFNEQGAAYRTDRANFWSLP